MLRSDSLWQLVHSAGAATAKPRLPMCFLGRVEEIDSLLPRVRLLDLIVSPDESRGYLGFSTVTPPPPQRFPFGRDNLKNILVTTFKFGMWVYMGNATNAIVL